jgi:hypothetical protein
VTATPTSLEPPVPPQAPDADWATVVDRLTAALTDGAPVSWSDHNLPDPGITLAEVAAYAVADLHYRTAERDFLAWPLEVRAYEPEEDRHWHATMPPAAVTGIAAPLAAGLPTAATALEPLIRRCHEPSEALALLATAPWSGVWNAGQKPVVIALMRARLVRQTAQEYADVVAAAVDAETDESVPLATRDGRAALRLGDMLPLWPGELTALVRRERRRRTQEVLVERLDRVRAVASAADDQACRDDLAKAGLDTAVTARASEVDIATAAARIPFGRLPEKLETVDGATQVWPPHPVQALTCEPVVATDYARRAREHPDVGRAWAVPGRLSGIAWNGLPTGTTPDVVVDPAAAAAVTLVVERVHHTSDPIGAFLRSVLTTAIGSECFAPFPTWQDTYDSQDPRRVICDEVGASLLREAAIVVQGLVVTGVGVDPQATLLGVRSRIAAFFAAGRGPVATPPPDDVDGPWPLHPQPVGGWVPGDPIRFTEVIQAMVADPSVLGVEDLEMQVDGDADFATMADGSLSIPPDSIPVLAGHDCLGIRFALAGDCSDA